MCLSPFGSGITHRECMPRCASVKFLSGFGALKSALKVLSSRIWVCPQDLVLSRMLSQCSQAGFGCALRNRCSQSVFKVLSKVGIGALKVLSGHRVLSRHGIGALKVPSNSALKNRCSQVHRPKFFSSGGVMDGSRLCTFSRKIYESTALPGN